MFELIPFDRRNHSVSAFDPFRAFDDMEHSALAQGAELEMTFAFHFFFPPILPSEAGT